MAKSTFFITTGFVVFWIVAIVLRIDDRLYLDAKQLADKAVFVAQSDAYTYMLGFDAPLEQDPLEAGIEKAGMARNGYLPENPTLYFSIEDTPDLHCNTNGMQCFVEVFYARKFVKTKTPVQQTLINRYHEFMKLDDYAPTVMGYDGFPVQLSPVFFQAQRLSLLDEYEHFALKMQANYPNINKLIKDFENIITLDNIRLGLLLEKSLLMGDKVLLAIAIGDNINILAMLKIMSPTTEFETLKPLTVAERSLRLPAAYEVNAWKHIMQSPAANSHKDEQRGSNRITGAWFTSNVLGPYFIKPHMLANTSYHSVNSAAKRSEMTAAEYYSVAISPRENTSLLWRLRSLGLADRIQPEAYDRYVVHMFALEAKISIFNTLVAGNSEQGVGDVYNPFYERSGSAYLTARKSKVCVSLPIDSALALNCLPISITPRD